MIEEKEFGRSGADRGGSGGSGGVADGPRIVRPTVSPEVDSSTGQSRRDDPSGVRPHVDTREGHRLVGIVRSRGWRGWRPDDGGVVRVGHRDIAAVTRPAPFALPPLRAALVQEHQRTVEQIMRRATILPAPYGVVFQGRRAVQAFLEDQYLVLDEGLSLVHGHWELRLHVTHGGAGEPDTDADDVAMQIYADLRRHARAAIPFPREPGRLLSTAFLVPRTSWIDFVERAESLGVAAEGLVVDVTGPWPPYDFVRIVP